MAYAAAKPEILVLPQLPERAAAFRTAESRGRLSRRRFRHIGLHDLDLLGHRLVGWTDWLGNGLARQLAHALGESIGGELSVDVVAGDGMERHRGEERVVGGLDQ